MVAAQYTIVLSAHSPSVTTNLAPNASTREKIITWQAQKWSFFVCGGKVLTSKNWHGNEARMAVEKNTIMRVKMILFNTRNTPWISISICIWKKPLRLLGRLAHRSSCERQRLDKKSCNRTQLWLVFRDNNEHFALIYLAKWGGKAARKLFATDWRQKGLLHHFHNASNSFPEWIVSAIIHFMAHLAFLPFFVVGLPFFSR